MRLNAVQGCDLWPSVPNTCPSPRSLRDGARALRGGCPLRRWAQAVECGLEDRLYIAGVATDRRDGVDQVEGLFEGEVVANLAGVLRGGEQRLAGGGDPGAAAAEHGVAAVGVLEQLRGDVTLACEEGEELVQPGEEARAGSLGGLADGVDLVGIEGLKELAPAGEVAVEGCHANVGASRDLGHRH